MTSSPDNFAQACCGRWAADRARFALYGVQAGGGESAWTFWDIQREANRFSNVLGALGVMRGDRVAIMAAQRAETAALHVACYQMGAVAVALSVELPAAGLARAFAETAPRVAAVDAAGGAALAALPAEAMRPRHAIGLGCARAAWLRDWPALRALASPRYAAQDGLGAAPALLLGAGGAQLREFTHDALAQEGERFRSAHPGYPQPGDLFWSPADWGTPAGLLDGLLPAWCCGQPVVACDGGFDAEAAIALIGTYDVRNVRLTAAQLDAMMARVPRPNEKLDCRLRTVATDGAPLAAPLAAWLKSELGAEVAGAA